MKQIFFLLMLLQLCFYRAQFPPILEGGGEFDLSEIDYNAGDLRTYKDNNGILDPFIGTWKSVINNKTFKINLRKKEDEYITGFYADIIVGDFIMIENEGQVNETVLFTSKIAVGSNELSSVGFNLIGKYPYLSGTLFDNTKYTSSFKYINTMHLEFNIIQGTNTAHWKVKDRQSWKVPGYDQSPIPMDVIMTRL